MDKGSKLDHMKGKIREAFQHANPSIWGELQHQPELINRARKKLQQAESMGKRMWEHCSKHRQLWIAQETARVWQERERPTFNHPAPDWAAGDPLQTSCRQEARKRVDARISARMVRVNQLAKEIQQRPIREKAADKPSQELDALRQDVHQIISRVQTIRDDARKHFSRHREFWIAQARAKGAEKPERDVAYHQMQRLERLNQIEHRLIDAAFLQRGKEPPAVRQQNHSHSRDAFYS